MESLSRRNRNTNCHLIQLFMMVVDMAARLGPRKTRLMQPTSWEHSSLELTPSTYLLFTRSPFINVRRRAVDANDWAINGLEHSLFILSAHSEQRNDRLGLQTATCFGRNDSVADCLKRGSIGKRFRPCDRALDSCAVDSASENRRPVDSFTVVCGALVFVPTTSWERYPRFLEFSQARVKEYGHLDQRLGSFSARILSWVWERTRFRLTVSRILAETIAADESGTLRRRWHNTFLSYS